MSSYLRWNPVRNRDVGLGAPPLLPVERLLRLVLGGNVARLAMLLKRLADRLRGFPAGEKTIKSTETFASFVM